MTPVELLGLTATPERSDGLSVTTFFDNRIAAELRLWDAIDQQRLSPFMYFGIHDGMDLRDVPWRRGRGYDTEALSNLLTGSDAAARLVLKELQRRIDSLSRMRTLGFCVSVEHAQFMARVFNEAGVSSAAVWADTPVRFGEKRSRISPLDESTRCFRSTSSTRGWTCRSSIRCYCCVLPTVPRFSCSNWDEDSGRAMPKRTAPCSTS